MNRAFVFLLILLVIPTVNAKLGVTPGRINLKFLDNKPITTPLVVYNMGDLPATFMVFADESSAGIVKISDGRFTLPAMSTKRLELAFFKPKAVPKSFNIYVKQLPNKVNSVGISTGIKVPVVINALHGASPIQQEPQQYSPHQKSGIGTLVMVLVIALLAIIGGFSIGFVIRL